MEFPDQGITLIFDNVTAEGLTGLAVSSELPFGPLPGIGFISKFYQLTTSATHTGNITLTIHYDDAGLSQEKEERLRLFRITDEGVPTDITTDLDTQNNLITGRTESLSYFAIGYSLGVVPTGAVISHGPNPVPPEGCIFWLNLPENAVMATLKIFAVDGAELVSVPLDPKADRYPETGRWIPRDTQGRPLGSGLYLYLFPGPEDGDSEVRRPGCTERGWDWGLSWP